MPGGRSLEERVVETLDPVRRRIEQPCPERVDREQAGGLGHLREVDQILDGAVNHFGATHIGEPRRVEGLAPLRGVGADQSGEP